MDAAAREILPATPSSRSKSRICNVRSVAMDRQNLMQIAGSLAALMGLFALMGQAWAVYPMTAAGFFWSALWLTKPGALKGVLYGILAVLFMR